MTLKSHPDKSLKTHVSEVREAVLKIWSGHSDKIRESTSDLAAWLDWTVTMHDVGKASTAFQQYIRNVKAYRGDRRRKAHTPMSFVTALGFGRANAWSWQKTLAVALCAAGHHSGFKTHVDLEHLLNNLTWQDTLVDQLDGFEWSELSQSVLPDSSADHISAAFSSDDDLDDMAVWFGQNVIENGLHSLPLESAIFYRLQCQFVHSVLLEADKAFLIVSPEERSKFRDASRREITPSIVKRYISESTKSSALDSLRISVRQMLERSLADGERSPVQTMSLPTGSGKTLLASSWALHYRELLQTPAHTPPIIIVLPFLSIIEQTQAIYERLLRDSGVLLSYHSLAVRDHHDSEDPDTAEFFLDTWHGDVIITTFDQFLFALLDPRARHQMRFHCLCDALVIMDEIQALPCKLWDIVSKSITQLTKLGNCRVLAMSATQTGFLPDAVELIDQPDAVFASLDRYEIVLRHREITDLDDFIDGVIKRTANWREQRVLIVLNTRNSARTLRDRLVASGREVAFISADVTPRDRLKTLESLKHCGPCIVVSTQCIEAGVDIDMSLVIRDFAPLDSLIQVSGRCNRNADRPRETVEVVRLQNESGRQFCEMVYTDKILLQETTSVLNQFADANQTDRIAEGYVFKLSRDYFTRLKAKKDQGKEHTTSFARWEAMPPVRELLRGAQSKQEAFVVIEQDPELPEDLERVNDIDDHWQRRRELRKLASRVAAVTVSVYSREGFSPDRFADRDATDNFWLLRPGYYTSERGIDFSTGASDHDTDTWGMIV